MRRAGVAFITLFLVPWALADIDQAVYAGCGVDKGCLGFRLGEGMSEDCISSQDCVVFTSYRGISETMFEFEIYGDFSQVGPSAADGYVSIGLNKDAGLMSPANIMSCLSDSGNPDNTGVFMYHSDAREVPPLPDPNTGITNVTVSVANEVMGCTFQRDASLDITLPDDQVVNYDLTTATYFMIAAIGMKQGGGIELTEHDDDGKGATGNKVYLGEFSEFVAPELETYLECGQSKECWGLANASGCVNNFNCDFLVSWRGVSLDEYLFEIQMTGLEDETSTWGGVGISYDEWMGDDSIVVCADEIRSFINPGNNSDVEVATPSHAASLPYTEDEWGVRSVERRFSDGVLYCSFIRHRSFSWVEEGYPPGYNATEHSFDLNTGSYRVVFGYGPFNTDTQLLQKHTDKRATGRPIDFLLYNPYADPRYDTCGRENGCIGYPLLCEEIRDCQFLVQFYEGRDFDVMGSQGEDDPESPHAQFTISGDVPENSYLSFALSADNMMGSDLVFVCSSSYSHWSPEISETSNMFLSWNSDKELNSTRITHFDRHLLNPEFQAREYSYEDGFLSCSFQISSNFIIYKPGVEHHTDDPVAYNLDQLSYYVLLASGPMDNDFQISEHAYKARSGTPMKLWDRHSKPVATDYNLVKLHASFMIFAWMFSGSCGIFTAMYCKKQFGKFKLLGKDVWFPVHQVLMSATWLLGLAGFIFIVAQYNFRPLMQIHLEKNKHALVGIISIGLMFIQPFMAILRPPGNHKLRPIFNYLHFAVGYAALILSMVAVYKTTVKSFSEFMIVSTKIQDTMIAYIVIFSVFNVAMMGYTVFRWKNRKAHDIVVYIAGAAYIACMFALTVPLLVYVQDSTFPEL